VSLSYIRLEKNTGRANAGNVGIKAAQGEYIGFLDDDDEYNENHIDTLISCLRQSEYKIAYTDARLIHKVYDVDKETLIDIDRGTFHSQDFSFNKLLVENFIPFMCIMFPRIILQSASGFDETLDLYEDWDLLIRLGHNIPFYHIRKATARYNIWSEHLQITEKAKYSGETGSAYSRIFHKHLDKFTHETIQSLLREREREKEGFLHELREQEREKEAVILDREVIISQKEAIISEKSAEIEKLHRAITEKDISLSEIYKREKEALLSELREQQKQEEAVISELKEQQKKKEAVISELREREREKEGLLSELREQQKEKEAVLSDKEREIEKQRGIITEKDFLLEAVISELREREREKSEIYNSLGWQFLLKYRRSKDVLLPLGTKRRRLYEYGRKGITVIKNEGFRRFSHKARTKLSTEIFNNSDNNAEKKVKGSLSYDIRPLNFPKYEMPEVSVIIPVFNNFLYTFNCIKSLLENTEDVEYEVIVIDDASTDNTRDVLKGIPNIRLVANKENLGFIQACNIGSRVAKSDYLVFLNNDTKVTKGWLKALLETAQEDRSVGIVGAKLIYPNGKLQEAGGIVWSDGSAWNYGRNDDPEKPEYNYLREVDYCSGACILVRKDLFDQVNGFDIRYSPAYNEDSDLAFTLRSLGYKTMYQPRAEIIHFEGTTAGTDTTEGIKKYQEINRGKFIEKWKTILVSDHLPPGKDVFLAKERNHKDTKRMLFIDHYVPTYDKDAGSVRMYEYLKIFIGLGFKIVFWPDNLAKMEPYTGELQRMGIEVIYGYNNFNKYIDDVGKYFDVAYLSRAHIAIKYINKIKKCTIAKIIYDSHDLAFLREKRRAEVENNSKLREEIQNIKQREFNLAKMSDAMIVVSPFEKEIMLQEDRSLMVYHLPHVHPLGTVSMNGFAGRKDIMFIGGFVHPPNEDGVCWFVQEILPRIMREIPDIRLYIIGSYPTKKVKSLSSENVIVTGYVHDVSHYFQTTRVCVAPIRYGAGVKGKIIHSMSYGVPVVTTTIGAEGLGLENGANAFISDSVEAFAEKVLQLYRDAETWSRISKNSFEWAKVNFSPEVAKVKLSKMFHELGILS
jgi:GT2 family glycosyltransferase